jgi:sirohydrochlorin ferrochelatase
MTKAFTATTAHTTATIAAALARASEARPNRYEAPSNAFDTSTSSHRAIHSLQAA